MLKQVLAQKAIPSASWRTGRTTLRTSRPWWKTGRTSSKQSLTTSGVLSVVLLLMFVRLVLSIIIMALSQMSFMKLRMMNMKTKGNAVPAGEYRKYRHLFYQSISHIIFFFLFLFFFVRGIFFFYKHHEVDSFQGRQFLRVLNTVIVLLSLSQTRNRNHKMEGIAAFEGLEPARDNTWIGAGSKLGLSPTFTRVQAWALVQVGIGSSSQDLD